MRSSARWSRSGPWRGSSTARPRSPGPRATTAGSSSSSGSSPNRSRRKPRSATSWISSTAASTCSRPRPSTTRTNETVDPAMTDEADLRAVTIGEPTRADGPITLADYDPGWPTMYEREATRIRAALDDRVLLLEHAGSTSVPGLAAKPVIDIVLGVADPADEAAYVPDLERAGYVLRIREPDWFEHRMFKDTDPSVQIHVFAAD